MLKSRVEKAKELRITKTDKCYHTWNGGNQHYEMCLSSNRKDVVTPDGYLNIPVFYANCTNATLGCKCKGNTHHTVCYHSIGAIYRSFEAVDSYVSFYNSYHDAIKGLAFGGYIAKIVNGNGKGHIWCVVRKLNDKYHKPEFKDTPVVKNLDNLAVNLMRGEEDEGID